MAKQTLPTNFKDDVLADSMGGKRRYILTDNGDGTFSLEDATTYTQVGDIFGAARLNAICGAVNESVDQAKVIDSIDTIKATTQAGYPAGSLAVKQLSDQLNSDLSSVRQSFQDGCNTIVAGCTTYGAAPAGNSPAQIVAAIAAIYNNRYNAGYSAKVPYVNTAYTLTGGQSYTIPVGYAPNCICIYVPYLSGTSYRGYAMALKNGSKYQMSDQSPGVINAGDIVDWNVTFSDTGVTFTAPKCILRGSIACEVFVA